MCRLTTCHNSLVIGSRVRRPAGLEVKQLPQFHLQRLGSMAIGGERLSHRLILLCLLGMAAGAGGRVP